MKESALPPDAILLNKPVLAWDRYKFYIIAALAFFLLETALIIFLIIQSRHRRLAEESLRQKTEELNQFFNVNLDILCIANTDGYFLRLNPAAERILGYTREELMAKQFLDFVHPDDLDRTRKAVATLASQQKVYSFENRYRCKDGTYRWLQWSSVPAGKLIYAAARDITERRQTEDALRQSEAQYRLLAENSTDVIWTADLGLNLTYLSPSVARTSSYTREELMGLKLTDHLTPASFSLASQVLSEALAVEAREEKDLKRSRVLELEFIRKDGSTSWDEVSITFIRDSEGKAVGILGVARPINERKRAEETLKQSEERFRQVAENVGDFIWEVDANGLYRYTSPSVEKILGYRPDEVVGKKHFYDLFTPEVREELKAAAFKVFASKGSFRAFPNPNLSKEGKVVHLETSGSPVLDAAGNLTGYRGADTDVSERKRAEEELRKYHEGLEEMVKARTEELSAARDEAEGANRAKSEFLSNMSHELRTPLNSILGIAQLMGRDAGFPEQHRNTLEILNRSGAHLLELINDVLELSKIEAGKMAADIASFDLHSFLSDLEEMIRLRADQKGLKLLFEHKSPLPHYIETDVRKVRQILINLLGNAIKYTEKGGVTLRVGCRQDMEKTLETNPASTARLEFEIEDTGIGIALEDMQRIFEPFVQVTPGRTTGEGTGLGLTLSRSFIELLGGEITIRSEVGRGTTFAFHIPVKLAEAAAVHTQEAPSQVIHLKPGHPPYRLLVVDDNGESRFVLRRLLEQVGFSVLEAASGQEAVDLYQSDQPHLIWMDLRMPGMDGEEAARRIREVESGRQVPIIALTAGAMRDQSPSSHPEVFDGRVYKPFREAEIFDKLEKHLGVQFVYQSSARPAVDVENIRDTVNLTSSDLSILSADWLNEFYRVLRKGHSGQLLGLIDQIRPEHGELAGTLAGLVQIHRFDKLLAVTEGVLKENTEG